LRLTGHSFPARGLPARPLLTLSAAAAWRA